MDVKCNDCGGPARQMSAASRRRGSQVREPNEDLCSGCSSTRVLMVRECERIPNNLVDIKAKRAPSVRKIGVA